MSKFKIPFITTTPVDVQEVINREVKAEMFYEKEREKKIQVAFNNKNSALRSIADFLYEHLNEEISYKQISKEFKIPISTTKICVADLNFFKGFPITMIPIPKKTGYIQSVLDNDEDYENWDRKKMKTITSMGAVRTKAGKITSSKRRFRKKQKLKDKEERKKQIEIVAE